MKRKINTRLLAASLVIVLLACGVCVFGEVCGSVYIRTEGTSSENIHRIFDSVITGDGKACARCTDSYKSISFDASKETDVVSDICRALKKSYSYSLKETSDNEGRSVTAVNKVQFSSLDLNKLKEAIAEKFEGHVFDTVKEYDSNVTEADGKYIPEVYEKAYAKALADVLQNEKDYYTSEIFDMESYYDTEHGRWLTDIDKKLAGMFQGGLSDGTASESVSVPKTVRRFVEDSLAQLKGEPVINRRDFSLPYDSTVGPKPNESNYITIPVKHADQVMNIVSYAKSCGLLGDQDVIFNPNARFYNEDIVCYCDDSILVICWKEYIRGCVCNCMEIKVADGSQIKRKITGDKYDSGILDTVSNMSAATNAVAAVSGDYYAYRDIGVTVYQGKLHRYQLSCEVLMIDDQGRFVFYYPNEESEGDLQKFIDKNNVQFSLAFGPVLIDNYKAKYYKDGYALGLGEMKECYSRAAFGEYDDLHYLFMTSGYSEKTEPPKNLNAFIKILLTKNLKNAYNVDGGQTAEIVIQNSAYNRIDYGGERQVSDMVFFATAIPEEESE